MIRRFTNIQHQLALVRHGFARRYSHSKSLLEELDSRGLIAQLTSPELGNALEKPITLYCGVDPTAPSLHVGNLVALMSVLHFHIRGHRVLPLVGGATGAVGDPGGRATERTLISTETLGENKLKIATQLERFFLSGTKQAKKYFDVDSEIAPPQILDNLFWTSQLTLLDFLRDVGKHAKVNVMVTRDSVKSRLESSQGISFTEFSYQLLQAHDFFHLYTHHGCRLQIGGADQWGNIIAGTDLIKRRYEGKDEPEPAYGLTVPLLTTPSGVKFGKSAGNAIWLDSGMTSVLDFYQYFVRQPDAAIGNLLRIFTFMSHNQIEQVLSEHNEDPSKRLAQRTLAHEATSLIHGEPLAHQATSASQVLYESDLSSASLAMFSDALKGDRRLMLLSRAEFLETPFSTLLARGGLVGSKGQADTLAKQGGLQLNGARESNARRRLTAEDLLNGEVAIARKGNEHLVLAVDDAR
ncbi:tyrosyl-tRNA synthetase [Ceratobasidium sp. 394]|nr:tyrosyl-tRNA synthetase [Ceratobasidium sp. 394]KAG9089474.1 tyrosyl-tRNA synthetase [Ceratobasidium sp. UAMH 11750]